MTQTNRSLRAHTPTTRAHWLILFTTLCLLTFVMAGCASKTGSEDSTGKARVGASMGSTGGVTGIGTSIKPGTAILAYKDMLQNGPSAIKRNHRVALEALKNGNYAAAATVFEETLVAYPGHPDATYYLGLTRIYQGQRDEGFSLLKSFKDPDYYRMSAEVQRMAAFLEREQQEKDMTAKTIHDTMNRYRIDGYNRDVNELKEYKTEF